MPLNDQGQFVCDGECGSSVSIANRHHKFVQITNARVNVMRAWCFCGAECRTTWWQAETDEEFISSAVVEQEVPDPENPEATIIIKSTPGPVDGEGVTVRVGEQQVNSGIVTVEEVVLESKAALDNWWQSWP